MLQNISNNQPKNHSSSDKLSSNNSKTSESAHCSPPEAPPKMKELGRYEFSFDWKLGSGLTCEAYLGKEKQTNKMVCVKLIDLEGFKSEKQRQLLENQIRCQEKVKSENIINILDIYDTKSFCFIVTQACLDGDLYKLIKYTQIGLPENVVTKFAFHIASALATLKLYGIIHRDIKSENIMLSNGKAKLGDFGFAIEQTNLESREKYNVGSPLYMPLEALEQNIYGFESDIFSFGIVLYEMLHGRSPWECCDEKQLIKKIKEEEIQFKESISEGMQNLIRKCLEREKEKRITIEEVLKSGIFEGDVQN